MLTTNKYKEAAKLYHDLYPSSNFYKLGFAQQLRYVEYVKVLKNG